MPHRPVIYPGPIEDILATIRYLESRGRYDVPPNRGNASGAYQFIASTWQNYGGYPHAYLAPPYIQDERAAADVTKFLKQWGGDVTMVPLMWYYPRAATDPSLLDVVPLPSAGNVLTIREYQQRWLGILSTISGQPVPKLQTASDAAAHLGVPPDPPDRDDDLPSLAFPVLGPSRLAVPDCDEATLLTGDGAEEISRAELDAAGLCADTPPSIVFGVKLQPVLAATDGVVTDVRNEPDAPISVTITDTRGRSYHYAGFNDDTPGTNDGAAPDHLRLTALATIGTTVRAGQIIGFMGDTDPLPVGVRTDVPTDATVVIDADATAPHLRLTILDLDGTPIEAFGPVLDAQWNSTCRVGIGPWSVPARSTTAGATTIETTDDDRRIDSEWIITASGQVTASGWAAMINPHDECDWTPAIRFGAGAAGSDQVPSRWSDDIDLETGIWLELALAKDASAPRPLLRP